jgi:hypothetical protein
MCAGVFLKKRHLPPAKAWHVAIGQMWIWSFGRGVHHQGSVTQRRKTESRIADMNDRIRVQAARRSTVTVQHLAGWVLQHHSL